MSLLKSCRNGIIGFQNKLFRRKTQRNFKNHSMSAELAKCLTTFDLTNLGIGSILGAGIYVVVGQVSMNMAGPSVTLSLAFAAFTSLLSGLCYAEFGSRVPRTTGSAYAYSYHTVGEFVAFIIGWNLVLEYMIGTAADARALSSAIDYLLGNRISNFTMTYMGRVPFTGANPDILGFFVTMTVTMILAAGVKESARFTAAFNVCTCVVGIFIIIAGSTRSNLSNWNSTAKFFPSGAKGVLSGAATCFYAYVGFDIIATAGEESRSPSKSIPIAMGFTLGICFVFYLGVATVLTMMMPFRSLQSDSPIAEAFDRTGLHWAKWIVGFGGVAGMSASLIGSEFPLPRIIYAMSTDGLIFKWLSYVWNRTDVPIFATIVPGVLTALFTMLFDLSDLVEMMSIGTLLAYSLVCTSILLLRYQFPNDFTNETNTVKDSYGSNDHLDNSDQTAVIHDLCRKHSISSDPDIANVANGQSSCANEVGETTIIDITSHESGKQTSIVKVIVAISLIWIISICWSSTALFGQHLLLAGNVFVIVIFSVLLLGIILCVCWLSCQAQDMETLNKLHFKVPLVPMLPACAIILNIMLMMQLSKLTWVRFSVWLVLGFILYFGYGVRHSKLNQGEYIYQYSRNIPIIKVSEDNS